MQKCKPTYSFIKSHLAQEIDDYLMKTLDFSSEQLMELAGLSVARLVQHKILNNWHKCTSILVVSGPGNNGGDGLVAARHLKMFGFDTSVYYPKESKESINIKHKKTCIVNDVNFVNPKESESLDSFFGNYHVIIDAVFGYSFNGSIRPPFDDVIKAFGKIKSPIISVDVPSGWVVDENKIKYEFTPSVLISLGVPKICSEDYDGEHYLGGRFMPKKVLEKFGLTLPYYGNNDSDFTKF